MTVKGARGISVLLNDGSINRQTSEHSTGTRVGQDLSPHFPVGLAFSMAAHRASGHGGISAQLELAREQLLHAVLVHDQHHQINTASPPICRPQLPPTTLKGAGALHPVAVRQVATPLPYSAPNTNPPFLSEGATPTQTADPMMSWGMPLSGAAMISSRTSAAAFTRFTSSSRSSDHARLANPNRTAPQSAIRRIDFLVISSPHPQCVEPDSSSHQAPLPAVAGKTYSQV